VTKKYLAICRPAKADTTLRLLKAVPQIVLKASHSQPTVPFPSWVIPLRNQNSSVSIVTKQRSHGPINMGTHCHLPHSTETNSGTYADRLWNLRRPTPEPTQTDSGTYADRIWNLRRLTLEPTQTNSGTYTDRLLNLHSLPFTGHCGLGTWG